ncbi:MAG: nitric oxide reductase [Pseudomonadales bacterium]|nr:nitric oxide reductase [Pseudomonadales bacterium]
MEEAVGKLWHRWITRAAQTEYDDARVELKSIRKKLALYFHAFGGQPGLAIKPASREQWQARRSLLEKIAGVEWQTQLCWRDDETLFMPGSIALFNERELNEHLFLWLAALAASDDPQWDHLSWLERGQQQVVSTLLRWPGLNKIYQRLVSAHIAQRHAPKQPELIAAEHQLQKALSHPDRPISQQFDPRKLEPVPIWLHPFPPQTPQRQRTPPPDIENKSAEVTEISGDHQRKAKRVEHNKNDEGLLAFRLESLFSWAEFANVDRPHEDDEDLGAEKAANDLDEFAVSSRSGHVNKRLKFDLDLPSSDYDDVQIGNGITTPEWDYRKGVLQDDHCQIELMRSQQQEPGTLPAHLRKTARQVRAFFEMLALNKTWLRQQPQGSELDLDAYLDTVTRWRLGQKDAPNGLFKEVRRHHRDLSCLLLADLSLSTDAAVSDDHKVIDVIRDGLFLMSEAMEATGDRFAMAGFSSKHRHKVRYYPLKQFNEPLTPMVRGRIKAVKPDLYTRMGAAIRYATRALEQEHSSHRLLLLLSDGKPNDVDRYDGRYGIEDTRMAIQEATSKGILPFCITIDNRGNEYLPYLFGHRQYLVIRNAKQLPQKLPLIYARLTESL